MKKTCEGCRAFEYGRVSHRCLLGYNNQGPYSSYLGFSKAVPQEPCPKPRTNMALISAPKKWEVKL